MDRKYVSRWWVMVMLAVSGCAPRAAEVPTTTVRDSSGVRIVEHSAEAVPAESWAIDLDGAFEFVMPESELPLFRIAGALQLDDGRVVVADGGNNRLVFFTPEGEVETTVGRGGDGPGEFRRIQELGRWMGDSLAVWDDRARRVSLISPRGEYLRSFALALPEGVRFARVLGFYPDGSFLGMSFTNFGAEPLAGLQRTPIVLHHFASNGDHLSELGEAAGTEVIYDFDNAGQVSLYAPHFYRGGFHEASDRLLKAPNDDWELTFLSPDGDEQQIVRWLKPPVQATEEAFEASWTRVLERTPEPRRAATRDKAADLRIHETLPAFNNVVYDRVGRVWLQGYDPFETDPVEWTVVGPEGDLLATIILPRGLTLRDAGADWALVRLRDDLGVETMLRATLNPIAEGPNSGQ